MMALAVFVSLSATIMSPLGVRSILLICQSLSKLLTCYRICSASSPLVSLSSPAASKYADAYIVNRLSGVRSSSVMAFISISLLECLERCMTELVVSEIIRPSQGDLMSGPSVIGMWCPDPPRILPFIYSVFVSGLSYCSSVK